MSVVVTHSQDSQGEHTVEIIYSGVTLVVGKSWEKNTGSYARRAAAEAALRKLDEAAAYARVELERMGWLK